MTSFVQNILSDAAVRVPRHLVCPALRLIAALPREMDDDQRLLLLHGDETLRSWEWLAVGEGKRQKAKGKTADTTNDEPRTTNDDPDQRLLAAVRWAARVMRPGPLAKGQPRFRLRRMDAAPTAEFIRRRVLAFFLLDQSGPGMTWWNLRLVHPWALAVRGSQLVRAAHPDWSKLTRAQREAAFQELTGTV